MDNLKLIDVITKINEEKFELNYNQELKVRQTNICDDLGSISKISNVEKTVYGSSLTDAEIEEYKLNIIYQEQTQSQKFGDDVHMILEKNLDQGSTKDFVCNQIKSDKLLIEFDFGYEKLIKEQNKIFRALNLDTNDFCCEVNTTDGINIGKFDLAIKNKDKQSYSIVDYKTSSKISLNYELQINLYRFILTNYYNLNIENTYIIKVNPNTYELESHSIGIIPDQILKDLLTNHELEQNVIESLKEENLDLEIKTVSSQEQINVSSYIDTWKALKQDLVPIQEKIRNLTKEKKEITDEIKIQEDFILNNINQDIYSDFECEVDNLVLKNKLDPKKFVANWNEQVEYQDLQDAIITSTSNGHVARAILKILGESYPNIVEPSFKFEVKQKKEKK